MLPVCIGLPGMYATVSHFTALIHCSGKIFPAFELLWQMNSPDRGSIIRSEIMDKNLNNSMTGIICNMALFNNNSLFNYNVHMTRTYSICFFISTKWPWESTYILEKLKLRLFCPSKCKNVRCWKSSNCLNDRKIWRNSFGECTVLIRVILSGVG